LEQVAKEVSLDLWIINHFRKLPTEECYEKLTDAQKELIYVGYLNMPTDEQLHRAYSKEKANAGPVITHQDAVDFRKRGYSAEQIEKMQRELEKAFGRGHG